MPRFKTPLFLALPLLLLACDPPPQAGDGDAVDGDDDGSGGSVSGDGDSDGDQPFVGIPPGVIDGDVANENNDSDGYCFNSEAGYYPCDDGAPPGSGPPGWDPGGTGGTAGGDGDGDTGGGNPGDVCIDEVFGTETALAPRILLVVDKSGSMGDDAVGYSGSKWTGAVDAIDAVVDSLESSVEFGLMLYPDGGANFNQCNEGSVDVDVDLNNASEIGWALAFTQPGGGTPTAATLVAARGQLDALGSAGGSRAVILATDGGPNCNGDLNPNSCVCTSPDGCSGNDGGWNCLDDINTVSAAAALTAAGYSVFVVGIPGSENYTGVLNGLAEAGGTALPGATKYYEADDSTALAASIEEIASRIQSCRFDLDVNPNLGQLTVSINGSSVSRDPTRTNGWDLVDGNTLELFGAACTQAMSGAQIGVEACGSVVGE